MKIYCKDLKQEFATKQDMFTALKASKEELIGLKKSQIKRSDDISYAFKNDVAVKDDTQEVLQIGDTVKVAMNTTNYFDSDRDVLIDGSWNRTAKEQNGKTYHVADHELKMGNIVGYPKDVSISVENIEWSKLGKDYSGSTDVLIFNTKLTDKTNNDVFMAYRDGEKVEHSIRLVYVRIKLAFDSDDPKDKEEKAAWDTYYEKIANKEDVDEVGYFWAVTEAKIYKEGSTVLFGANDATPQLKEKIITEPDNSIQAKDNQSDNSTEFDYEFITQNIFKNKEND
jgi:type VI protein secretion system component Hcp